MNTTIESNDRTNRVEQTESEGQRHASTDPSDTRGHSELSRGEAVVGAKATEQTVAARAYEIFLARGAEHGNDVEDWLQAEREIAK